MRKRFGILICVWILLWGNCLARFEVEKNCLKLTSPERIKGTYDCAIGSFGVPQYGGTLVGRVIYPGANQRACRDFKLFYSDSWLGAFPAILLVDRGYCFFSLKAWHAQMARAAAVLVADDRDEPLITMYTPEDDQYAGTAYLNNITIPSAFISKSLGDRIKKAVRNGEVVTMNLDWGNHQSLHHSDERVKYEFWTSSNFYECGPKCHRLTIEFIKNFKGAAQILEQKGYTQFTPHYRTLFCPRQFILSKRCKSTCINHGRYCAPDPKEDFSNGYDYEGKDVVVQNLRQACFFKVANGSGKPWLWWDYVTDFAIHCPMEKNKYTKHCADQIIRSLGVDLTKVDKCIGDTEADVENPVLRAEQDAQMPNPYRGDVTILPTLVINNREYRVELKKGAVLKAICGHFEETKEPAICSNIKTNDGTGWTRTLKLLQAWMMEELRKIIRW